MIFNFLLRRIAIHTNLVFSLFSEMTEIQMYLNPVLEYNFTIRWGDGSVENYTNVSYISHQYSTPKPYLIEIYGEFPDILHIKME